jgi:DNA-binding transcriptional MerR regulator
MTKTYTTGQVAKTSGVPPETLIRWHREGLLRPSVRRKKGVRRYTVRDLVAAVTAKVARDDLKFPRETYKQIAAVVQRANPEELARAEIVTIRTREGEFLGKIFIKHCWIPPDNTVERAYLDGLPTEKIQSRATLLEMLIGKDGYPGLLKSVYDHLNRQGIATKQDLDEYLALRPGDAL